MTTVTVVIPALNDAEMLRHALAALAAQTRPADEVIVVDNGSTDATADVARAAGARVLTQPVRGIMSASATGYDAARTDLIARIDADSRPPADWLERIVAEFDASPAIDVLTGPGAFYGEHPIANWLGEHLYIPAYFHIVGPWLGTPPIFGSNFAMRAEVWRRVSDLVHRDDPRVHDDLDLVLHLPPDVVVRYDETLRVGVSARPLETWRGFGRRLAWAYHTFAEHWPEASPWARHSAKRAFADPAERERIAQPR
ncbi:glycosyltransferase family 2 protein [Gryllotalpicola ginsengisoli]|uniref:glycosyltransferase family 2 protein n=1 Tax=Gryllotalpicola ginsengisoli TaxID=444608 RepID=UPI00041815BA|nr:glycosyltransferase family 2 protein [Gryllotalpicola ginsengisoli]